MAQEKFLKDIKKYNEWTKKAVNSSIEYLERVVKENGNCITLDPEYNEYFTASYDGGSHPEYASNCFSQVDAIFIDAKLGLCVEIEDDPKYEITRMLSVEIIDLAQLVHDAVLPRIQEEQDEEE